MKLFKNLRAWNIVMGCLHFAQGIAMVVLTNENSWDVYTVLPEIIVEQRRVLPVAELWYSVNLGYVIASFLFLSAAAHFITSAPRVFEWYKENLAKEINLIRWFEYALSSSVMIYVIGILSGVTDGLLLLAIVALNACMNLFGASMEMYNSLSKKENAKTTKTVTIKEDGKVVSKKEMSAYKPEWSNFVYGTFAGIIPWVIMGVYFFITLDRLGSLENLPEQAEQALQIVRFIFPTLFVFFNLFAINMVLQYKQVGPWKNYLFGEKVYIILSLTAKSFLAWFIWGGTLR